MKQAGGRVAITTRNAAARLIKANTRPPPPCRTATGKTANGRLPEAFETSIQAFRSTQRFTALRFGRGSRLGCMPTLGCGRRFQLHKRVRCCRITSGARACAATALHKQTANQIACGESHNHRHGDFIPQTAHSNHSAAKRRSCIPLNSNRQTPSPDPHKLAPGDLTSTALSTVQAHR